MVWAGTATLLVGQPEGHRSSWRCRRSDSHLNDKPNFTNPFLALSCYLAGDVAYSRQPHGCCPSSWLRCWGMKCWEMSSESAPGLRLIGCLLDDQLPCARWHQAWAETAVSEAGDGHPKLYSLRMETAAVSKSLWLIKDLVSDNSSIFRSHQSPGAASIRLGRRWGPRILGNLGFFFSSPSFSVLMLFYKWCKAER